jgi:hypothetical protein
MNYDCVPLNGKQCVKIYGPLQEKGEWRVRYNQEFYQLNQSPDIIRTIQVARLR